MRLCKRHPRHHQVVERQCCAGALRLQHCGFGSRCQLCSQDTHWLHFSVLTLFTTTRLLRRFRRCLGRLLCGREWLLPPEGTAWEAPRRCLVRDPGHQKAAGRRRSVAIIAAGLGCEDMLTRHVAALVFLPCVSVSPCGSVLVLRGGTPGGCCAWAAALGVCHRRSRVGELPKHTPQSHFSVTFLVLTRDGSSLLFFDCGFCSVLLAVFFLVSSVIRAP